MNKRYILGTRGSLLATTQSQWVVDQLPSTDIVLQVVKTEGDNLALSLTSLSQPGAFVNALRNELLAGSIDFIVHSFKDLPSDPHPDIELAAVTRREDPRDVLISYKNVPLLQLEKGSVVGTSSPRRQAAISAINPHVQIKPIRGNIDSRIQKVKNGDYTAIVLAAAGLARIGRSGDISEYFDLQKFIPAPAQGALAIECRVGDVQLIELLSQVNDPITQLTTTAERAVLLGLNAGCDLAVGAYASLLDSELTLVAELGELDGRPAHKINGSVHIQSLLDIEAAMNLGLDTARQLRI